MPQGQRAIIWDAANNERFLYAIVACHKIEIDRAKVASLMGGAVTESVIQTHIWSLTKKAKEMYPNTTQSVATVTAAATPVTASKKRAATANISKNANKKTRVEPNDNDSEGSTMIKTERKSGDEKNFPTTPKGRTTTPGSEPGNITTPASTGQTPRSSSRQNRAISYRINDSFDKLDREGVFNDTPMIEGAREIELLRQIEDDSDLYASDATMDEFKIEDASNATNEDMDM